mmetsp:Transcript_56515/g.134665  ORF Transcript_56515/g.134665 Transcript_56515/m.134665 type:complete len:144 (+) Transcript_56515:85-516(+)|eukprot:CAMPEP_0178414626 /NCGR_PEP_ID=MMETSP0689_2-20121128/23133_1 /TAXON_ID=160604 /ORGANISM="Amphidinium massartii, Strain CS-259" /LENGTH=143 /DNA_ID=CAMNT_0020035921 /DNA_START=85 /DNA_END=516 /DNA_ORIENTATION=-
MAAKSVVAAVLLLSMCSPVSSQTFSHLIGFCEDPEHHAYFETDDNGCGGWYQQKKDSAWVNDDQCCAKSSDECCEANPGGIAGAVIGVIVLIAVITLISCGCCGCCPGYKLLPCSKCNVGCCIPATTGGAQPPVVVGKPVETA